MSIAKRVHGGNAPNGTLDFSAPLNPLGPPEPLQKALVEAIEQGLHLRYPDPSYDELREAIAHFYSLKKEHVLVFNGAAEALNLLPVAIRARSLIVLEPCFGDHELLAKGLDSKLIRVFMKERGEEFEVDETSVKDAVRRARKPVLLVFSRPNNPTGALVDLPFVEEISRIIGDDGLIVVDEAFIDFTREKSAAHLELDNVVVVRSLTKTFATPGLRLGFTVSVNAKLNETLDSIRQAWNVNSLAAYVFSKALRYKGLREMLEQVRVHVERERRFLEGQLRSIGLKVYKSCAPYLLVRHDSLPHPELQRRLIRYGVYVRDASSFAGLSVNYSRVSVKTREENCKLIDAMKRALKP